MAFVLIVDEQRTFKTMPEQRKLISQEDTIIYVRNAKDAIAILDAFEVDVLWLDCGTNTLTAAIVSTHLVEHKLPRLNILLYAEDLTTQLTHVQRNLRPHYKRMRRVNTPASI